MFLIIVIQKCDRATYTQMYSATPELPPPEQYTFTISVFNDPDVTGRVMDLQVVGEDKSPHLFHWKETKEHNPKKLLNIQVTRILNNT